ISIIKMRDQLRRSNISCVGAISLFDRAEGGHERLIRERIPYISVMSLQSLRRHCRNVIRVNKPARSRVRAEQFLRLSDRLQITDINLASNNLSKIKIMIASGRCPPVSS